MTGFKGGGMGRHIPRKRFGQHFLRDESVVRAMLSAINPMKDATVVEIGPGLGALTLPLLTRLNTLHIVEIDTDLQAHWRASPEASRLTLHAADALTLDYSQWGKGLRVVGNLPYNISTPLIFHLLQYAPFISDMHFMLQKEVVERLAAPPGSKDYGRLSIMVQYLCAVDYLFDVGPEAFDPPPRVDSAVVRLTPWEHSPYEAVDVSRLQQVVTRAFSMRRKTIANALKPLFDADTLRTLGLDPGTRPEQLAISDYIRLAGALKDC